jgi:hypothetical protein
MVMFHLAVKFDPAVLPFFVNRETWGLKILLLENTDRYDNEISGGTEFE